jgi:hypothetical protein
LFEYVHFSTPVTVIASLKLAEDIGLPAAPEVRADDCQQRPRLVAGICRDHP